MIAQKGLYYAAAATTAIAGILHLTMAPGMLNFNPNGAVLFFVAGIAQLFWVVPMIRRWGKVWYGVGIGGTIVLAAIYSITRIAGNPITGRGFNVNEMGIGYLFLAIPRNNGEPTLRLAGKPQQLIICPHAASYYGVPTTNLGLTFTMNILHRNWNSACYREYVIIIGLL